METLRSKAPNLHNNLVGKEFDTRRRPRLILLLPICSLCLRPSFIISNHGIFTNCRPSSRYVFRSPKAFSSLLTNYSVPLGIAAAVVQASIYDVPGGYRAVMFDRFSGVKDEVRRLFNLLLSQSNSVVYLRHLVRVHIS